MTFKWSSCCVSQVIKPSLQRGMLLRRALVAREAIIAIVNKEVQARLADASLQHDDLIQALMQVRSPVDGRALPPEHFGSELFVILWASIANTHYAMVLTLLELLRRPELMQAAVAEADAVLAAHNGVWSDAVRVLRSAHCVATPSHHVPSSPCRR